MAFLKSPRSARRQGRSAFDAKSLKRIVEDDLIRRVSYDEYRAKVQNVYGGPKGALLATASLLSLHLPLGERLIRERRFDLARCRRILDVGSGAGQLVTHLLKYADRQARITCVDLSWEMLRRARQRLKSPWPRYVVADITCLPFPDSAFDCITCGYVLEHLPDARPGLAELSRVLEPGGKLLLLTTEDTYAGALTSRFWTCRTYNRRELYLASQELGLRWTQELWFTRLHRWFKAGGICVEMQKQAS